MNATTPTVASLLADLDTLRSALQTGDLAQAEAAVDAHERDMHRFLQETPPDGSARTDLQQVHEMQQALLRQMAELREQAVQGMQAHGQAGRVAHAYQTMA